MYNKWSNAGRRGVFYVEQDARVGSLVLVSLLPIYHWRIQLKRLMDKRILKAVRWVNGYDICHCASFSGFDV